LKEYITAGVSKDDFLRRIRVLLESRGTSSQTTPAPEPSQTQASSSTAASNATSLPAEEALQPGTNQAAGRTAIGRESSPRLAQDQPGEASASSDSERKDQNRPEESGRKSEAQGRKPTPEDAPSVSQRLDSSDMSYAAMQRKRLQEAKEERARILKRVEDDKIERRKREAERKAELKAKEAGEHLGGQAESSRTEAPKPSRSKECAIQIRLFDGSTIRSRFPSSSTLRADVRPWVDEHQAGNAPYTFKHVLTPLPNKNISISDEEQTLEAQGLTPSATLILVPVQGYVSAYEGGGNSGLVSKTISTGYGLVSSGVGMVSGLLGSFLGGGSSSSAQHEPASTTPAPPSAPNINIRTLRDQNRLDENQFYNGNSVSKGAPAYKYITNCTA